MSGHTVLAAAARFAGFSLFRRPTLGSRPKALCFHLLRRLGKTGPPDLDSRRLVKRSFILI